MTPAPRARLTDNRLDIAVIWQDVVWDLLRSFKVDPVRTDEGYVCMKWEPEHRRLFGSLDALWRGHLFEPLLDWANIALAPARWLVLERRLDEGSTWARLDTAILPNGAGDVQIVPVYQDAR